MLSQQVLLSLLQQLGYDLTREPVTKLNWIKDTAVALDPQVLVVDRGTSCMLAHACTRCHAVLVNCAEDIISAAGFAIRFGAVMYALMAEQVRSIGME